MEGFVSRPRSVCICSTTHGDAGNAHSFGHSHMHTNPPIAARRTCYRLQHFPRCSCVKELDYVPLHELAHARLRCTQPRSKTWHTYIPISSMQAA